MSLRMDANLMLVGAGALGAWYLYGKSKRIAQAVNPLSSKNVAYQGASGVVQALTGSKTATVGTWLYDLVHPTSSATSATALPAGSPGWYASYGMTPPPTNTALLTNPFSAPGL